MLVSTVALIAWSSMAVGPWARSRRSTQSAACAGGAPASLICSVSVALTSPSCTGQRKVCSTSCRTALSGRPRMPSVSVCTAWARLIWSTTTGRSPPETILALRVVIRRRHDDPPTRNGAS
jgi:hypothetical protein